MARITVEDCLEKVPNRFCLVLVAAERTKQLIKGDRTLLADDSAEKNKEVVTSLREIAAGFVEADLSGFDVNALLNTEHGLGKTVDAALPPEIDDDLPPEA